jgi:hypothetical protein
MLSNYFWNCSPGKPVSVVLWATNQRQRLFCVSQKDKSSDQYLSTGRNATLCRLVICTSANTTWRTAGTVRVQVCRNYANFICIVPILNRFRIVRCNRLAALYSAQFNYNPLEIRTETKISS